MASKIALLFVVSIISLVVSFVIEELFLRTFFPEEVEQPRRLFLSDAAWQLDNCQYLRYRPNSSVRSVALYGAQVKWDVVFTTNNFGFVDPRNYPLDKEHRISTRGFAFIGDSFTAGTQDERPWVAQLRETLQATGKNVNLYNFGVDGAGIAQFVRLYGCLEKKIPTDEVVIIGISDDFYRAEWRPLIQGKDIRGCNLGDSNVTCLGYPGYKPLSRIIEKDQPLVELIRIENELWQREEQESERADTWSHSRIVDLYYQFRMRQYMRETYASSVSVLREFKQTHPNLPVHFLHLPQMEEVARGTYSIDLQKDLAGSGIDYFPMLKNCAFSKEMYLSQDKHLTPNGYHHLANCVTTYLFN